MSFLLQPWHILLATVGGLVDQRQQQIIEFQNARIKALLKKLGKNGGGSDTADRNDRREVSPAAAALKPLPVPPARQSSAISVWRSGACILFSLQSS